MKYSAQVTTLFLVALTVAGCSEQPSIDQFKEAKGWKKVGAVSADGSSMQVLSSGDAILINPGTESEEGTEKANYLYTVESYQDFSVQMEFMIPENSNSGVYFMGRYEIQIADSYGKTDLAFDDMGGLFQRWHGNQETNRSYEGVAPKVNAAKAPGEWQVLEATFRAPRFAEDGTKLSHAIFVNVRVNGQLVQENLLAKGPTRNSVFNNEASSAPLVIEGRRGPIAIRKFDVTSLDLSDYETPTLSAAEAAPLDSNGLPMVDFVAIGRAAFSDQGCFECHVTTGDDSENRTGPSLFGLLQSAPKTHSVIAAENTVVELTVDQDYIRSSVRNSEQYLALKPSSPDEAYEPVMPSYSSEILTDNDLDAIVAYLETLNDEAVQGALKKWIRKPTPAYVLSEDKYAVWVKDSARLQRVDVGDKHSARAYHVGLPGDVNYNFDPRILGVVDIWSGPFMTLANEKRGRANKPSDYGYGSKVWTTSNALFQPLYADGSKVDFSFKEPTHVDEALGVKLITDTSDYLDDIKKFKARFGGVDTPKGSSPSFRYQVGENRISVRFEPSSDGSIEAAFTMSLQEDQAFLIPADILSDVSIGAGNVLGGKWTVPAGNYNSLKFEAKFSEVPEPYVSRDDFPDETLEGQPLHWEVSPVGADLLSGYSITSGVPPLNRFGREQLFEPMGITFLNEEVTFISTRTAGIWKIVNGKWYLFAEGIFESLGLVAESESRVVIGEKPGLTELIDNDGDHWAESRNNLSDEFRFTGNYHAYLHGPIKYNGSYLYNLNLEHNVPGMYKAGGLHMGTSGGLRGWFVEVDEDGEFKTYANGFRSPAGLAVSPSNEIIYTENQGEYVGTSKVFKIQKGKFYGNPTGLVDMPGSNYLSPEVQWSAVQDKRERPVVLLPHNKAMNSPGSPVWDLTGGQFGPFSGQMLLGDQTHSNIYRVFTEKVNGVEQGVLLPFADGMASGVMRLTFNPTDNSLWVGQTGRGWASKGDTLSALQRIEWNGETPDAIHSIKVMPEGFEIVFTKPQQMDGFGQVSVKSWYYNDSPNYGSPELGTRQEAITSQNWSDDAMHLFANVENFAAPPVEGTDTSRIYHIDLKSTTFGEAHSEFHSQAYYTLHAVPVE